jgi:hypothetical protein
MARNFA